MIKPPYLWRRPRRWLRRTGWLLGQMRADFGLGIPGGPVWLRDNPFLVKAGRAETRGLGLSLRLLTTVLVLSGLLLGGLTLQKLFGGGTASFTTFLFHSSFPVVLFVVLSFVHMLLIANARTATAVSLAEEARRGTLPDLLLTPLRRAEMLLAMGVGPARSAFLIALAGLPLYALLGQFGGLTGWEIVCLYVLFGLLCYGPPVYAFPALSGLAPTPDAPVGQFTSVPNRQALRRAGYLGAGFPLLLGFMFFRGVLNSVGGGWLTHFFSALHLPLLSGFSFLIFFSWPYYVAQILSDHLNFFHLTISPLWYVLPLMGLHWASSALTSASALSAGDLGEMRRLPLWTRAQTLSRWTARVAGLCVLGIFWQAWVESGDTAALAGGFGAGPDWNAAGVLLLLGGLSLPNVCARALAVAPRQKTSQTFRAPLLVLRRALQRSVRPLGVAGAVFLVACALGGLSPFGSAVYQTAGKIALAGLSTVFWAVGVRRVLPRAGKWVTNGLLYAVPFAALSVPGGSLLAAFSPASAWVRLFADGPALISRFPFWKLETLPSFWICAAGPFLVGIVLMAATQSLTRQKQSLPVKPLPIKRVPVRNEKQTAVLMRWITERTDNPLFTYEMRVRTRSGRWFDWLCYGPIVFVVAAAVTQLYPQMSFSFSAMSPFRFFDLRYNPNGPDAVDALWTQLASLLLLGQCYILVFRGPVIGQSLIERDMQRGTWGFILLTPLTIRQIFLGKAFGQIASLGALWAGTGLAGLLLYILAVPLIGLWPALGAWGSGQLFVVALLLLGVSLGAALAAFPALQKSLRGISMLLFVLVIGLSVYAQFQLVPFDTPGDWSLLALRLVGGSVYTLLLSALLFGFAEWR
ncbi:MAG: hypothetical protein ACRYFS_07760, partial [Janthinobacterium lividum]